MGLRRSDGYAWRGLGAWRGEGLSLDAAFARLKEQGSAILVVGEVPLMVSQQSSRRLFGHPDEPRERLLIRLERTASLNRWFAGDIDVAHPSVRIVDRIDAARSTAVTDGSAAATEPSLGADTPAAPADPEGCSLDDLVEDCRAEIDAAVAAADRPARSQLRVGVFAIDRLRRGRSTDRLARFVSAVSSAVVGYDGIVHFHLRAEPSSPIVRTLTRHVDARITLRKERPGSPSMQRWTVPEYGTTPWVPLSEHR